jgi:2,3-bisphosphoglycerate-independent phosphoglycerate mutase
VNDDNSPSPLVLVILDGFGLSDQEQGNAIAQAETPFLDELFARYPWSRLKASGEAVGLPEGQIGNSEVGHMNLGAGRTVLQPLMRINEAIRTGDFFENDALVSTVDTVKKNDGTLHLVGLLSDGGVHSHESHVEALLEMAQRRGLDDVALHAQLDGRDVPPQSAEQYIENVTEYFERVGQGYFATLGGRYYGMDRDERWDRTEKAYRAMVHGESDVTSTDPVEALREAYQERDETDEFVTPTVFLDEDETPRSTIGPEDGIVFFNFRPDRARQLTRAFTDPDFDKFETPYVIDNFVCMTEYDETFELPVAFPPLDLKNCLTEYLSERGLKQFHAAETEKYAHVTFFFNGGVEEPFPDEERSLIPSPKVSTYDKEPAMSAEKITETVIDRLHEQDDDFLVVNYANPDMVGHTGDLGATIESMEVLDSCLYELNAELQAKGGEMVITADHGNAETMIDSETNERHTAHTLNDCPLIYVGPRQVSLADGTLADVAPTLLKLMDLPVPEEMTGSVLAQLAEEIGPVSD